MKKLKLLSFLSFRFGLIHKIGNSEILETFFIISNFDTGTNSRFKGTVMQII